MSTVNEVPAAKNASSVKMLHWKCLQYKIKIQMNLFIGIAKIANHRCFERTNRVYDDIDEKMAQKLVKL